MKSGGGADGTFFLPGGVTAASSSETRCTIQSSLRPAPGKDSIKQVGSGFCPVQPAVLSYNPCTRDIYMGFLQLSSGGLICPSSLARVETREGETRAEKREAGCWSSICRECGWESAGARGKWEDPGAEQTALWTESP